MIVHRQENKEIVIAFSYSLEQFQFTQAPSNKKSSDMKIMFEKCITPNKISTKPTSTLNGSLSTISQNDSLLRAL